MSTEGTTILLIDLVQGPGTELAAILSGGGFIVRQAAMEDAPGRLETGADDAVIIRTSCVEPAEDGIARVCDAALRSGTPVVFMTPRSSIDLAVFELSRGIFHITTPCRQVYLLSRLEEILQAPDATGSERTSADPVEGARYKGVDYSVPMRGMLGKVLHATDDHVNISEVLREMLSAHSKIDPDSLLFPGLEYGTGLTGEEQALCSEMIHSLKEKHFELHYQPIIHMGSGSVSGFEALIRWNHPQKGLVPPDSFIGLAERTDIIIPLGFWILEEACRQLDEIHRLFPSNPPLYVSVNVSARQFVYNELDKRILEVVDRHGLPHESVRLELTESAFMDNKDAANLMLLSLKSKGFQLYMDDFGTGYSSLSYLMHFPVDVLKIDQSFVKWMHVDEESEEIVRSVVALSHNLKRKAVAEGVDNEGHVELLRSVGCDYGQGYFFSRPLDFEALKELLKRKPSW
jgi:EAL domain-containing protein (putative c-di-GMP-specific phosphodiesterase class I)